MKDKQLMTTGDVARYCGVNFRTVIRWIDKGRLDAFKLPGRGDNRIPLDSFLAFLNENNMPIPEGLLEANPLMLLFTTNQNLACDLAGLVRRRNWRMRVTTDEAYFGFCIAQYQPSAVVITDESHQAITDKMLKELDKKDVLRLFLSEQNKLSTLKKDWDMFRWPSDQSLLGDLLYKNAPQTQQRDDSQRILVN